LFEDLLEQNEALSILVKLCFELSQLLKLRGPVFLWK